MNILGSILHIVPWFRLITWDPRSIKGRRIKDWIQHVLYGKSLSFDTWLLFRWGEDDHSDRHAGQNQRYTA